MKIKTEFWREMDPNEWKKRMSKFGWILGIFGIMNGIFGVSTGYWILTIINAFPVLLFYLILKSFNKYEAEEWLKNKKRKVIKRI